MITYDALEFIACRWAFVIEDLLMVAFISSCEPGFDLAWIGDDRPRRVKAGGCCGSEEATVSYFYIDHFRRCR